VDGRKEERKKERAYCIHAVDHAFDCVAFVFDDDALGMVSTISFFSVC